MLGLSGLGVCTFYLHVKMLKFPAKIISPKLFKYVTQSVK